MKLFKKLVLAILFTVSFLSNYAQYCGSAASNGEFEYINRVKVGCVDNESESSLYADYTEAFSIDMHVGSLYTIIITNASHDPVDQVACWIDWNNNEIFEEDEKVILVYQGKNKMESVAVGNIIPPVNTKLGRTRMRIMLIADISPDPCAEFVYGEVEDYTINVQAG